MLGQRGTIMKDNYKKLFRINPKTGNVIIEVSLNDYIEIFHEWDHSAFKKRDIHPELVDFLDLCSEEIPFSEKLEIQFFITNEERDKNKESLVRASYTNYYKSAYFSEKKIIKRIFASSGLLSLVSLTLLFLYTKFSGGVAETMIDSVLFESLLIGGWVLAWEAIHGATIDVMQPLRHCKDLKRFLTAEISFRYTQN